MLTPIFDKAHSKIIESWDTINFRVPQSDWLHSIITMPTKRFFDQVLIDVSFINMQKIRLFHLEIWLIKKSCNMIGWEQFGPHLRNKNFPKYGICVWTQQNMALWRITLYEFLAPCQNSEKTNDTIPWKRPDRLTVVLFLLSSLVTCPSLMSIWSLVLELWQFSFIKDWPEIRKSEISPSEFCPIPGDWGELWIPN